MINENQNIECCPKFDPALWDDKIFEWDNKKFIKDRVRTAFYVPLNFGGVMKKIDEETRNAGATIQDGLCLSEHTSRWNMDIYAAVDKEVPGAQNIKLSGKFLSKVYEGDFKETGKWCKDFESRVKDKGLKIKKMYMWYTTCPKCAKKYGKNYTAIISQVE